MIYEYECISCEKKHDVYKPHTEHRRQEFCPECNTQMRRLYSIQRPIVDTMEAEYYHSLGQVVKSKRQRKELIKKHDLIEVGNESPKTVHREMDTQRQSRRLSYEV